MWSTFQLDRPRRDWVDVFEVFEDASTTGKLLPPRFDRTLARLELRRADLGVPG